MKRTTNLFNTLARVAVLVLATISVANAQTIAYWKMNQVWTNDTLPVGAGGFTHGIRDLATNSGQGTLTGGATGATASEEHLFVWGPIEGNFQVLPSVPPLAMFNQGYDSGGASWNSANNLGDGGAMFYPHDQYGNEFSSNAASGLTFEIFFKSSAQTGVKQTLIWNFQGSAYTHLQLNEDGDTGSLLFWGYNGGFPTVRITAADNGGARLDDGNWHYAAIRYDATIPSVVLTVVNQDGSTVSKTNIFGTPLFPGNGPGNMLIGRTEGEGDRFNGLINQVRISSGVLTDSQLLAAPGSAQARVMGHWKFGGTVANAENFLTSIGIADLATNPGQGTLTNASFPSVPASEDPLWVLGNLAASMTFVGAVPPVAIFNTNYPFTAGTGSWDAGADVATDGEVTFQHDVYGQDLNHTNGGFTAEVLFKSASAGSATSRETLFFNHKTHAYFILQVSEDGDTGSLLLWGYNGGFPSVRITAAENGGNRFDDGNWHYAACRYDTSTKVLSLLIVNEDGSTVEKTTTLGADLIAIGGSNGGTVTFGRSEGADFRWNGLINQVRFSDAALPNKQLLAKTPDCVPAAILTEPAASVSAPINGVAEISVAAQGTERTYQWRKGGVNLAGKTNVALTLFPVTAADAGNYDVLVSAACSGNTVTSSVAVVTVTPATYAKLIRWSMDATGTNFPCTLDSNTSAGQGYFTGGSALGAEFDHLLTFNDNNPHVFVTSNDVPPSAMFINGNTGGTASFAANSLLYTTAGGGVFYPQDQYGNELSFRSSFSVEAFFKTEGDQSTTNIMQLLVQAEGAFRYAIILNEAGPGALRFALNNGSTIQVVDLAAANYANGSWHYVLAEYEAVANVIRLTVVNSSGTTHRAVTALPAAFGPLFGGNDGNMFIGKERFGNSADPNFARCFAGLLDEIQITDGLVKVADQLGFIAFPAINITSLSVNGATVTIDFAAGTTDTASAFVLQGSATVNGVYADIGGATITSLGGGNFQATVSVGGAANFYKIRRS
jgi:hypothetical protein